MVFGTTSLRTRALGAIADSCWARLRDILAENPRLTPVIFFRNPGEVTERPAGAVALIEATSEANERVLVIRGFDPLQDVITHLNAGDFFERWVDDFLVPRAKAMGIQKIVVPGGPSGGSQTNVIDGPFVVPL
ncbi:MAG: hypothetical protein ACKVPX_05920 [Myxococcaceae bacterium]